MAGIVEEAIPTAVAATEDGNGFRTHQQPPVLTSPSLSDSLIRSDNNYARRESISVIVR